MARQRDEDPTKRTRAFRNLLQHEDLTVKMARRKTTFALAVGIAVLALLGWLLGYFA